MAEDPILIKIQAVLDKEAESAFRKTNQEITNLKTATAGSATAQAAASVTTKAGTAAVKEAAVASAALAEKQHAVAKAAQVVNAASRGSMQGIGGMLEATRGLSGAFGGLIGTFARFAGWVGIITGIAMAWKSACDWAAKAYYEMKNGAMTISENGDRFRKLRRELEQLNETKLDGLKREVESIKSDLDDILQSIDQSKSNRADIRSAEMEREIAKAEIANPNELDRSREVAAIRKKYKVAGAIDDVASAEFRSIRLNSTKGETQDALAKAQGGAAQAQMKYDEELAKAKANPEADSAKKIASAKAEVDGFTNSIKGLTKMLEKIDADIANADNAKVAGRIRTETAELQYQKDVGEIDKRQGSEQAGIQREFRRVTRADLERKLKTASPSAQKGLLQKIADLDNEDRRADAEADESGAKGAVLGDDISLRNAQVGDDFSEMMRPKYEKIKGARETAGREAMEARAAEAAYRKNPKNKQAGAIAAKEHEEALQARANLEKALAESERGRAEDANLMTKYIETAAAERRKMLDRMNRRP